MRGKTPHEAAAIEARQEAGVKGKIKRDSLGDYFYWKRDLDCFLPRTRNSVSMAFAAMPGVLPQFATRASIAIDH